MEDEESLCGTTVEGEESLSETAQRDTTPVIDLDTIMSPMVGGHRWLVNLDRSGLTLHDSHVLGVDSTFTYFYRVKKMYLMCNFNMIKPI